MRTGEVVSAMRAEGFDLTPGYLDFLIRERHLHRPGCDAAGYVWTDPDVQRLKSILCRRNRGPNERRWR